MQSLVLRLYQNSEIICLAIQILIGIWIDTYSYLFNRREYHTSHAHGYSLTIAIHTLHLHGFILKSQLWWAKYIQQQLINKIINTLWYHVIRDLVLLNIWSEVRFQTHAYEENSVESEELTLCVPQILRRRLIIANSDANFLTIS
jgi:hypothetical protein